MVNCKDCRHWDKDDTVCNSIEWLDDKYIYRNLEADNFGLIATASDDQGLTASLKCGPLFGCVKGAAKSAKPDPL